MHCLEDMSRSEFRNFKRIALRFVVRDEQLFRKQLKNMPLVRVVDSEDERKQIISSLHNDSRHRGREASGCTNRKVANRYF